MAPRHRICGAMNGCTFYFEIKPALPPIRTCGRRCPRVTDCVGACGACADAADARPPAPNAAAVPPWASSSRRFRVMEILFQVLLDQARTAAERAFSHDVLAKLASALTSFLRGGKPDASPVAKSRDVLTHRSRPCGALTVQASPTMSPRTSLMPGSSPGSAASDGRHTDEA